MLVYGLGNTLVCVGVFVRVQVCECVCVRERERGSTQKEKAQEERAQCYQQVLLFFHLFVHYLHIKQTNKLLASLRLGRLSGVWMDSLLPGNVSGVWSTKPMKLK